MAEDMEVGIEGRTTTITEVDGVEMRDFNGT
jgi:hypothetical protein